MEFSRSKPRLQGGPIITIEIKKIYIKCIHIKCLYFKCAYCWLRGLRLFRYKPRRNHEDCITAEM